MQHEIKLIVPDDYCQGNAQEYIFQSPPEEMRKKRKLKSVRVRRGN